MQEHPLAPSARTSDRVPPRTLLRWVSETLPRLSRRTVTVILLVALLLGMVWGDPFGWMLLGLGASGLPMLFAATEGPAGESGPAPRNRLLATVTSPWRSGGGRGVVFLVLHLAAAWLAFALLFGSGHPLGTLQLAVTCAFAALYVLLPCALMPRLLVHPVGRCALRCTSATLVGVGFILQGFSGSGPHDSTREFFLQLSSPWALGNMITSHGRFVGHPAVPWVLGLIVVGTTHRVWRVKRIAERRATPASA